jgi:predicted transcriptional regulator
VAISPQITTRFRREDLVRIDDVARAEHRSRSNVVQRAMLTYVEQAERRADGDTEAAA